MKSLVVYESEYGNTAQVAEAVASALRDAARDTANVTLQHVSDAQLDQFNGLDLLVVGCPTQKFGPMPSTKSFLKSIPKDALCGVKVAAFDTRITEEEFASQGRIVAKLADVFGYAAEPIAGRLKKKGGELATEPAGFYVSGTEGPLLEGELDRAAEWGKQLVVLE